MDISALTAASQNSSAQKAANGLADNFDTFLTLLTTQLQNQDPLSPMDSNEFTAQLVQFAGVEQAIATNTNLETLVNMSLANYVDSALGYLGQEVTIGGSYAALEGGQAKWGYQVGANAENVELTVKNVEGVIVYQGKGDPSEGTHTFDWGGRDNEGSLLPDGAYSLEVSATAASGQAIQASTQITGLVSSIYFDGTEPVLIVNGLRVTVDQVTKVSLPPAPVVPDTDQTDGPEPDPDETDNT